MKNFLMTFLLVLICDSFLLAQPTTSGYNGSGANIDVVYQRLEFKIDPSGTKNIGGSVTTYFKTGTTNVNTLTFDLNKNSFNNASLIIKYHGITCTNSFSGDILNITLPSSIPAVNTLDSVTINYSGAPPDASGSAQGYQVATDGDGINYVNTLSESYEDRDWWPCKADMQDKVDAMDIIVTVPWDAATKDTFWVAANGKLVDSTITGNTRTFMFKTQYPIASYLVGISVARFKRYYRSVNIGGTDVQVVYNILAGKSAETYTNVVDAMDKINGALVAFSDKFGDYPFKNEKHGFYDGLLGAGGMENQTFSAIAPSALTNLRTLAHELMHQWFGDNVSFATWNDLWLAEGFARYSESLVGELVPSLGINPFTTLNGFKNSALSLNTTSTYIPNADIASSNSIWKSNYGRTIYERGCMVVSMLRALCGDSIFFNTLKDYQTNLAGKSATTDTLNNYFNRALGVDIKPFFDDFVKGTGNPVYNILWQPLGTDNRDLMISVGSQTKNPGSAPASYHTPLVLHVTGATPAQDTTIVIYDMGGGNLAKAGNGIGIPVSGNSLNFRLSFEPLAVAYDDSARTLSTGTTTKVSPLDLKIIDFSVKHESTFNNAMLSLDDNSTDSEVILERSPDGIHFSELGTMQKQISGQSSKKYFLQDNQPLEGNNFYRAKLKNMEGQYLYSRIIKISAAGYYFKLINNPVSGNIKLQTNNVSGMHINFSVFDLSGKKLLNIDKKINGSVTEIGTKLLPKGAYILKISGGDIEEVIKFVIN